MLRNTGFGLRWFEVQWRSAGWSKVGLVVVGVGLGIFDSGSVWGILRSV